VHQIQELSVGRHQAPDAAKSIIDIAGYSRHTGGSSQRDQTRKKGIFYQILTLVFAKKLAFHIEIQQENLHLHLGFSWRLQGAPMFTFGPWRA
jgi:hypothetical protein